MANSNLVTREDLKNVFEALGANAFGDYIVTRTVYGDVTISNTNYGVGHIDVTLTGYKPLGVIAILPASNTVIYAITFYEIANNQLNYTVRYLNGTTTATVNSRFTILYIKNAD